jgi:uncharacterized membrane protein YedE/YeeE
MRLIAAYLTGALFGVGLLVSRMANPAKVLSFLNFAGPWDASLALVMAAAVSVAALAFWWGRHRTRPFLAERFASVPWSGVNARLILGAGIFGIGWGLSGLCPGPALVDLPLRPLPIGMFVIAMLVGMRIIAVLPTRTEGGSTATLLTKHNVQPER